MERLGILTMYTREILQQALIKKLNNNTTGNLIGICYASVMAFRNGKHKDAHVKHG